MNEEKAKIFKATDYDFFNKEISNLYNHILENIRKKEVNMSTNDFFKISDAIYSSLKDKMVFVGARVVYDHLSWGIISDSSSAKDYEIRRISRIISNSIIENNLLKTKELYSAPRDQFVLDARVLLIDNR